MTTVNRLSENPQAPDRYERVFAVLGPSIVAGTFTAGLALMAALLDFHRHEMLLAAAAIGAVLGIPTLLMLRRQMAYRRTSQVALHDADARIGGIIESAMDAIVSVDESQRIVQFNAAAEHVFRWPRDSVLGKPLDVLIPERYRAAHHGHIERFGHAAITSRGMGSQAVLYALRADGTEFPIEASISQHGHEGSGKVFTVILRDVTQRVQSAHQLARSEARLREILDSAMDAIITVDENQHIVIFNKAAEQVFRCPRDEAVGAPLAWFIPERYLAAHSALVRRFGEAGDASRRMGSARVVTGLRRTGEEFPIEASISQVTEDGQKLYTVILRDVTDRVRSDTALRESREELREFSAAANSVREQEKSRIARELHDELGQALTALKIDVGWLRERTPADSETAGKLTAMQGLLDATVAAARRISADLRPLMLDDLGLTAACDWLTHNFTSRTGIPCELIIAGGDLDLPDPHATAVFRVLQESLTNVARHSAARQVEVTLERDAENVTLTVHDNGVGFSLGDPRKPNSFGLMGLRERAYQLGGFVDIESAPGKGTVVALKIPAPGSGAPA